MTSTWLMAAWTGIAIVWWLAALVLVRSAPRRLAPVPAPDRRRISIFKSLATPLTGDELQILERSLETFIAELDAGSELLLGCHERDAEPVRAFVERMRQAHPDACIVPVTDPDPYRLHANPKVSWMHILSERATGELWFWSDADMEAPPGTLEALREDVGRGPARFITSPYVIQRGGSSAALLDTLFVNLEFYPGAILLDRLDTIRFGFGSGMLFEAARFHRHVDWDYLGTCLADDFHLGRLLGPARLGSTRLATTPASGRWIDAILHYLRWQKTIRWCRPGAYASQIVILPLVGWLLRLALDPGPTAWLGVLAVLLADLAAAVAICRAVGCPIGLGRLPAVPLWSLIRAGTWAACWLPLPIVWRGRTWWSAHQLAPPAAAAVHARRPISTGNGDHG